MLSRHCRFHVPFRPGMSAERDSSQLRGILCALHFIVECGVSKGARTFHWYLIITRSVPPRRLSYHILVKVVIKPPFE